MKDLTERIIIGVITGVTTGIITGIILNRIIPDAVVESIRRVEEEKMK